MVNGGGSAGRSDAEGGQQFGAWLKQRRRELDLTQDVLAEQAGCSTEMVRKIEAGTARPSRQLAELIAARLSVPVQERPSFVQWARDGVRAAPAFDAPDGTSTSVLESSQTSGASEQGNGSGNASAQPIANPYKGLRPFDEADAADFFGRESLTGRLVSRLNDEGVAMGRFLAVVGPSGSGKSSVVRAGMVPALRQGSLPGSSKWTILDVIPGIHPFEELEAALLRVAVNPPASLLPQLLEDERGLLRAVKRVLPADPTAAMLIVLDQFEEVFTLVPDEATRKSFLDALFVAATDPHSSLRVVATLRADFYDRPLLYRQAGELVRQRTEVVLPMSGDELERAIVRPAARTGVTLEQDLLAAIIQDVTEQPGALPLLQYALTELFERRKGLIMTLQAYKESGGVPGALSRRAEAIYNRLGPLEQETTRQLFLRLVTLGEGAEDTRRRVRMAEMATVAPDEAALHNVLDIFGRYRLLTFDRDPVTGGPTVEVAHEALLSSWERLREWLEASRESLGVQRRLLSAATEWTNAGQDSSFLAHGVRLAQFEALQVEGDVALNAQEREFLGASQNAAAREEADREMQRQRELQAARQLVETKEQAAAQLRRRALFLTAALLVALVLAGVAFYFGDQARVRALGEQDARLQAEQASHLSSSRELAAAALNNLNVDPERSILLALQAVKVTYDVDKTWTTEAENALHRSVLASHVLLTFQAHNAHVWSVSFSPDGTRLATASQDGTAKIWDTSTGKPLLTLQLFSSTTGLKGGANSVVFSPNGKLLATGSDDNQVRLWDPVTGQLIRTLSGHTDQVGTVRFSPDGTLLGSASADKTAIIWDVATGKPLLTLRGHTDGVASITFSPDNKRISTGSYDGTMKIWDATTGKVLISIDDQGFGVFSPDGTKVAAFRNEYDAFTGKQLVSFTGHTNAIYNEVYSPDGTRLATVSRDRTARVWDATTGADLLTLWGHTATIYGVAFSRDGARLATGDENGMVKIWDMGPDRELLSVQVANALPPTVPREIRVGEFSPDGSRLLTTVNYGGDPTNSNSEVDVLDPVSGRAVLTIPVGSQILDSAFSPNGKLLATGGASGATRLWDAATGHELFQMNDPSITTSGIAFSPDGKRIATGDSDNVARVWDASTGAMQLTLKGNSDQIWGVAFSPDGKRLATASLDSTARVWDLSTGQSVLTLTNHTDGVYGIAYSPDGTRLATASRDGTAKIWDAATGKELLTLRGHTSTLTRVAFSPDGKRLVSASQDATIKVWDVATGEELLTLPGIWLGVFSPDGKLLATANMASSSVNVYTVPIESLVALAKSRLTRTWTLDECRTFLHADQCPP